MSVTERLIEVKVRGNLYRLWIDVSDLTDFEMEKISSNLIDDRIGQVARFLDELTSKPDRGSEFEHFRMVRDALKGHHVNAFQISSEFDRNALAGYVHYYDWP